MSKITLLGGVFALLVAAGATLAFEITTPELAKQRPAPAKPVDPAIVIEHLQNIQGELALP
jgi:uncharacterized membrane protein YkgB